MSRLSRAVWRCIPQRLVFRPDSTLTRFGRWAFRRTLRKMPRGEFITTTTEPAAHDPRCISLTDSEFNDHCDCRTLAMIDRETNGPTP